MTTGWAWIALPGILISQTCESIADKKYLGMSLNIFSGALDINILKKKKKGGNEYFGAR